MEARWRCRCSLQPSTFPGRQNHCLRELGGAFPDRPTAEQRIWTCDANGGNPKKIFDKASTAIWTADGKHLVVTKAVVCG